MWILILSLIRTRPEADSDLGQIMTDNDKSDNTDEVEWEYYATFTIEKKQFFCGRDKKVLIFRLIRRSLN